MEKKFEFLIKFLRRKNIREKIFGVKKNILNPCQPEQEFGRKSLLKRTVHKVGMRSILFH